MNAYLICKVYPGQFSTEVAVEGEQANGERFSLFAPSDLVITDEEPTRDRSVQGKLRVMIVEVQGDKAVARLPRESFESGRYVTVKMVQLQNIQHTVEA